MFCTIINDCLDADAVGRQGTRLGSLLGVAPTFVGVGGELRFDNSHDPAEIQAAGCLIDVLDAAEGRKGLVLVNSANRHSKGKKWPNGTPFAYFWYNETLVVSTIDGYVLSLVKKLGVVPEVFELDVPAVMDHLCEAQVVTRTVADYVSQTQFRSFDFSPRVGAYLLTGGALPAEKLSVAAIERLPECVWFIDNFGNVKTTLLPEDIKFESGKSIETKWGQITCYSQLKDVPNGETGCIIGSSGLGSSRFLEVTVQGKSMAQQFSISVGDRIV